MLPRPIPDPLVELISRRLEVLAEPTRIRLHECRHTAVPQMLDAGITIDKVSKFMGHASITITSTATATCSPAAKPRPPQCSTPTTSTSTGATETTGRRAFLAPGRRSLSQQARLRSNTLWW